MNGTTYIRYLVRNIERNLLSWALMVSLIRHSIKYTIYAMKAQASFLFPKAQASMVYCRYE